MKTREFEALVHEHKTYVRDLALRITKREEDADEVENTVWLKVWQAIDRFDHKVSVKTWLAPIVKHAAIDVLKRQQRRNKNRVDLEPTVAEEVLSVPLLSDDSPGNPEAAVTGTRLEKVMEVCLKEIPKHYRAVLLLQAEGLKHQEIAHCLGVPKGTVMSRLFRGRRRMAALLAEFGFGESIPIEFMNQNDEEKPVKRSRSMQGITPEEVYNFLRRECSRTLGERRFVVGALEHVRSRYSEYNPGTLLEGVISQEGWTMWGMAELPGTSQRTRVLFLLVDERDPSSTTPSEEPRSVPPNAQATSLAPESTAAPFLPLIETPLPVVTAEEVDMKVEESTTDAARLSELRKQLNRLWDRQDKLKEEASQRRARAAQLRVEADELDQAAQALDQERETNAPRLAEMKEELRLFEEVMAQEAEAEKLLAEAKRKQAEAAALKERLLAQLGSKR